MTPFRFPLRATLALLALAPLAACGGNADAASAGWAGTLDTLANGRVVAANPATGAWRKGEEWTLVEEVRIGAAEEEGPALFGSVSDVVGDPAGRIWVLEGQAKEIRVFDARGAHVRTIGRKGGGPGEFENPAGMRWAPDGRLWVLDNGNARFSVFDTAGAFVTSHLRKDAAQMFPWKGGFDAKGAFYDVGSVMDGPMKMTPVLVQYGPGMAPRDTFRFPPFEDQVFRLEKDGNTRIAAGIPFTPTQVWARSPRTGGVWLGTSDQYRFHLLSPRGDTLRTVSREFTPVPVTSEEQDEAIERFEWFTKQGGKVDAGRIPSTKQAFGEIIEDDQGWLWVHAIQPKGEPTRLDIFDPEGRYQGRVAFTETGVRVNSIQGGYVHAVVPDEADVPFVVRYRIEGRK